MSYEPHYIASFENESGLDKFYEPFLIPEKAFPILEDAYAWRGRIRKRQGFSFLGRLRRKVTPIPPAVSIILSTQANGAAYVIADLLDDPSIDVRSPAAPKISETNAEIQPGTLSVTVGGVTFTDNGNGILVGAPAINSGTINYNTGAMTLSFNPALGVATDVVVTFFYYPSLPVMALPNNLTDALNQVDLRAFDTKYCYKYNGAAFEELAVGTTWQGSDSNFFWTTIYWPPNGSAAKLFFETNFNNNGAASDPMRYYSTTAHPLVGWNDFHPAVDGAGNSMWTSRCIVPYKNCLLCFNTWEGANQAASVNYPQRMRFSQQFADPTDTGITPWVSTTPGKGGFIDVATSEAIVSVEFIKDILIVKFERSSWKIIYTGNKVFPFTFQKINTEFGAESTFSLIPFDRGVFSFGNVGICTDDSVNVSRIDLRIPDTIYSVANDNNGPLRVHGIRDFTNQVVYWTYPEFIDDLIFPNRVLVYNYTNQTFAIFHDSFTCYGYYTSSTQNTWSSTKTTWNSTNFTWNSPTQQQRYPDVVAGNQQGFVLIVSDNQSANDTSLSIQNITPQAIPDPVIITSPNHNLEDDSFIMITSIIGSGAPNPNTLNADPTLPNSGIYKIQTIDADSFTLESYDFVANQFNDVTLIPGGTYVGGGRITPINNINITTKVFAPFYEDGGQVRVGYIDFLANNTDEGQVTCNFYVDENDNNSISDTADIDNSGLLGSAVLLTSPENTTLIPYQPSQKKIWHRFFVQSIAQNFQISLVMSDAQMADGLIDSSDFVLHAMTIYLSKNARMTQ